MQYNSCLLIKESNYLSVNDCVFRGKHWCGYVKKDVKFEETDYIFHERNYPQYGNIKGVHRITKSRYPNKVYNQIFPGFLDRGSPLIIPENRKNTIVGIFRENLVQESPGPAIFDRLYPDIVNWIVETAEWTQDSDETNI